ncbi:MAG: hypothetical protein LWX09_12540 [Bacteroidia bacterium]|nr:hypothetical protein [Bacteroidia bacterium]
MLPDKPLSRFFTRHQVIQGTALPLEARQLNWQHIDEYLKNESRYVDLCSKVDQIILDLQSTFCSRPYSTFTLAVSSGFRCLKWEHLRQRTGLSQHTVGAALDLYPVSNALSDAELVAIMHHIKKKYEPSWTGGFAMKPPILKAGRLISIGFAHFDNRPQKARWNY